MTGPRVARSIEQVFDFCRACTPHRLAVHRAARRLADAVQRKDDRIDRLATRDESQRRIAHGTVALEADAALEYLVRDAALVESQGHCLGCLGEQMQVYLGMRG